MSRGIGALGRVGPWIRRWLVASAVGLAACSLHNASEEAKPLDPRGQSVTDQVRAIDLSPKGPLPVQDGVVAGAHGSSGAVYLGDTTTPIKTTADAGGASGNQGFDLNFENAPVATIAKVILGDILGASYIIDPRVQGTVTLASGHPIARGDVLFVLEGALRMSNVALIHDQEGYRLVPAADATGSGFVDTAAATQPGYGLSAVPLHYVSAQAILKLLDGFGIKPNAVRVDNARNIVLIQGNGVDRRAAVDTILSFDGDWMRGESVGVFPIQNSAPEAIIPELEKVMDAGDGGLAQHVVKFQAVPRLNAVLVVSRKAEYLHTAANLIRRLDDASSLGINLRVYRLRYGSARQVAAVLTDILTGHTTGGLESAENQIAPGAGASVTSSGGALAALSALPQATTAVAQVGAPTGVGGAVAAAQPAPSVAGGTSQGAGQVGAPGQSGATGQGGAFGGAANAPTLANIRITADTVNNSVLVYANQEAQRVVEQTIRQIDRPLLQVAIDATIAEVTLNDVLNYGVQYFLQTNALGFPLGILSSTAPSGSLTAIGSAPLAPTTPGFNLVLGPPGAPNIIINALHNVTDVRVLSNPSLVVLDNQPATLQVGAQVPISTGSATVLTANNTIVNTISYQNTGVILQVVPRISANGNVVLNVSQVVSSVEPGSAVTNLTPTFNNRAVKSSISVASGQTVLLAGLISDETDRTRQGIPVLDKLPGIGDLFSQQSSTKIRTELIIFIRPTVIRDPVDAHFVAEELRSKLNGEQVGGNFPGIHNGPVLHP
jgi:general secretion pathway protein D